MGIFMETALEGASHADSCAVMAARVGLTGGIGSGKTTVAGCFAGLGVQVIDADEIGRRLAEPGTAQFDEILARFGDGIVDSDGRIDRARLGRVVFDSPKKRQLLESILHPPIRAEMHDRARRDGGRYCILDIPLLVESAQHRDMERVVTVSCSRAARIRRLRRHRGMGRAEIEQIMKNQATDQQRLAVADDVIDNNGAVGDIAAQVQALHQTYLALFA